MKTVSQPRMRSVCNKSQEVAVLLAGFLVMEDEAGSVAPGMILFLVEKRRKRKKERIKRCWVKDFVGRRNTRGVYHSLLKELVIEDVPAYNNHLRMDTATMEDLLQRIAPIITKQDNHMRDVISPGNIFSSQRRIHYGVCINTSLS